MARPSLPLRAASRLAGLLALGLCLAAPLGAVAAETVKPVVAAPAAPSYKIGVADKIRITVYGETDLSGEFLVNADGSVALPLIGNINAAGLTAPALQAALEARLADGFVKQPRVNVQLQTYRPFYIYGQVVKPGVYPYAENLTVLKAVALAQGFTVRANRGKIFLTTPGSPERRARIDELVQPSDLIRVPGRNF